MISYFSVLGWCNLGGRYLDSGGLKREIMVDNLLATTCGKAYNFHERGFHVSYREGERTLRSKLRGESDSFIWGANCVAGFEAVWFPHRPICLSLNLHFAAVNARAGNFFASAWAAFYRLFCTVSCMSVQLGLVIEEDMSDKRWKWSPTYIYPEVELGTCCCL